MTGTGNIGHLCSIYRDGYLFWCTMARLLQRGAWIDRAGSARRTTWNCKFDFTWRNRGIKRWDNNSNSRLSPEITRQTIRMAIGIILSIRSITVGAPDLSIDRPGSLVLSYNSRGTRIVRSKQKTSSPTYCLIIVPSRITPVLTLLSTIAVTTHWLCGAASMTAFLWMHPSTVTVWRTVDLSTLPSSMDQSILAS